MTETVLVPLTKAAYDKYMASHIPEYANDRTSLDHETLEQALRNAKKQTEELLPSGLHTPLHHFFELRDGKTDVGRVWLKVDPTDGKAWLYHILVHPENRGQGYGRAAMKLVFAKAKELGARVLWLNVFEHNKIAKRLYESVGMKVATHHLNIKLAD